MKIIITTAEELESIIENTISKLIEITPPPVKDEPGPEFVTKAKAAEILDCSTAILDQMSREKKLKKYRFGGAVRFLKSDIINLPR